METTPPEIKEAAESALNNLLPTKFVAIYENAFKNFLKWCQDKNATNYSETVLLAYFVYLVTERHMKCSTMWSHYSMIKSLLNIKCVIDISKYLKLRAYLKKQNEGYTAKKSRIFTKEEFEKFLFKAPDHYYLAIKVVLIIGISGACRCDELQKMKIGDIEDLGSLLHIKIPDSKTKKTRSFTVVGDNYLKIYRKYVSLRPKIDNDRVFLKYVKGKCCRSVMGIHKISGVPREVASYLKLSNYKEYTGHAMRRTSATLLVDAGADVTCLKRHGGWRSSSVAEGYIEDSIRNKKDIAMKILLPNETQDAPLNLNANTALPLPPLAGSSQIRNANVTSTITSTSSTRATNGFNFQHV